MISKVIKNHQIENATDGVLWISFVITKKIAMRILNKTTIIEELKK